MTLEIHHHYYSDPEVQEGIDKILGQLNELATTLARLATQGRNIMVSVADVKAKADATLAQVKAEADIANGVKAVVDHMNEQIAMLKQQLADAIAAGVDPAALQALSDTIDAIQTADTSNSAIVASAVTAGTSAPAPDAGDVPPVTP